MAAIAFTQLSLRQLEFMKKQIEAEIKRREKVTGLTALQWKYLTLLSTGQNPGYYYQSKTRTSLEKRGLIEIEVKHSIGSDYPNLIPRITPEGRKALDKAARK